MASSNIKIQRCLNLSSNIPLQVSFTIAWYLIISIKYIVPSIGWIKYCYCDFISWPIINMIYSYQPPWHYTQVQDGTWWPVIDMEYMVLQWVHASCRPGRLSLWMDDSSINLYKDCSEAFSSRHPCFSNQSTKIILECLI